MSAQIIMAIALICGPQSDGDNYTSKSAIKCQQGLLTCVHKTRTANGYLFKYHLGKCILEKK